MLLVAVAAAAAAMLVSERLLALPARPPCRLPDVAGVRLLGPGMRVGPGALADTAIMANMASLRILACTGLRQDGSSSAMM
jgi:hypothetical protein